MITPYPPEQCGIAIYASKLTASLESYMNVTVIGNRIDKRTTEATERLRIVRCWKRNSFSYVRDIVRTVKQENPEVIHVQHEYLGYGRPRYGVLFPLLLALLRPFGRPIVLTMHSVLKTRRISPEFFLVHQVGSAFSALKRPLVSVFTRTIIALADHVIVHNQEVKTVLTREYGTSNRKVSIIVHGVDSRPVNMNTAETKRQLGLSDKLVILFFGFIVPTKGLEVLLKSFSRISTRIQNAILIIAGGYHPRVAGELPQYLGTIEKTISELQLSDRIRFENRYLSPKDLERNISAADIIVFPYVDDINVGASGALATCAPFGKAVIASRMPKFASDIEDGNDGILVQPNNDEELSSAIVRLAEDENLRRRIGENLRERASEREWPRIASLTNELYLRSVREKMPVRMQTD